MAVMFEETSVGGLYDRILDKEGSAKKPWVEGRNYASVASTQVGHNGALQ